MSNNKKVNKRRHRSPWYKPFAKTETRLSARVTREEDWQTDVPNIRLSRAFVIVLLMHLVVGGALIAFTLMNPHEANAGANPRANAGAAPKTTDKIASAAADKGEKQKTAAAKGADKKPTAADKVDDMRRHIVHSGDSVTKIAQQYGVKPSEIYAVNRIDEIYQLYQGRVLRIPVSTSAPLPLNPKPLIPPFNSNGSNLVTADAPRTKLIAPRAKIAPPSAPTQDVDGLLPESAADASRPIVLEESRPQQTEEKMDIVRPHGDSSQPDPVPAAPPAAATSKEYTVVKGDNPYSIAKRFGVNYKELLRHNGIKNPNRLQIGHKLKIPN